jgi:hypothetical protein
MEAATPTAERSEHGLRKDAQSAETAVVVVRA